MPINVILADDHAVVRDGVKAAIENRSKEIKVMALAKNGEDVLKIVRDHQPDVYLLDITMPVMDGFETAEKLLESHPKSKIIFLTIHSEKNYVERALKIGVKGYVLKENTSEDIVHAINEVNNGRFFISPNISKYVIEGFLKNGNGGDDKKELTSREKQIIKLIAGGYTDKKISEKLHLAFNTVHRHRGNIMKKLDMHKKVDLIRYAMKEGIIK